MKKLLLSIISLALLTGGCSKANAIKEQASKVIDMVEEKKEDGQEESSVKIDSSKKGYDLLKDVFMNAKSLDEIDYSYVVELDMLSMEEASEEEDLGFLEDFGGLNIQIRVVKYHDDVRYETEFFGEKNVEIYKADEGITYTFDPSTKEGYMYHEYAIDDGDTDFMRDFEHLEEDDEELSMVNEESIHLESLNGQEVVYFEVDDPFELTTTKVWMMTKYPIPVKFVTEMEDGVLADVVIKDIEVNKNFAKEVEVPSDIHFEDE